MPPDIAVYGLYLKNNIPTLDPCTSVQVEKRFSDTFCDSEHNNNTTQQVFLFQIKYTLQSLCPQLAKAIRGEYKTKKKILYVYRIGQWSRVSSELPPLPFPPHGSRWNSRIVENT